MLTDLDTVESTIIVIELLCLYVLLIDEKMFNLSQEYDYVQKMSHVL